jgi:ribosome-associated toxin RatA of RatAB toxin-antitoxin module
MRAVEIVTSIPDLDAGSAYAVLSDFRSYPANSPSVRSVEVDGAGDNVVSTWEVDFRDGVLRWTEEDVFDPERGEIRFCQIGGDIPHFVGSWTVTAADVGSRVTFEATFDLGIPTLATIVEPIAASALLENIASIVHGLFGADAHIESQAEAAVARCAS